MHPSLLPRWRGAAPVERAIMAGDAETGVTIHRTQASSTPGRSPRSRRSRSARRTTPAPCSPVRRAIAVELLDEVLPSRVHAAARGRRDVRGEDQPPADRELDWRVAPKSSLNRIRALSPHIGARAELHGRPVTVWRARVAGGRLEPVEVQPDGSDA